MAKIQDYFEYIIKNHEIVTENPPTRIYVNKIESRITFKIKTTYYFHLSTPETKKLLRSTIGKITKNKNSENARHFRIAEVVSAHCNIANNDYQQDPRILYRAVSNKSYDQLLDITPKNVIFFKRFLY